MYRAKLPRLQISLALWRARQGFLWGLCLSIFLASTGAALAEESSQDAKSTIAFDIPSQPLAVALERFMTVTNVAVLADSTTIAGRTSTNLSGRYSTDEALRSLLAGTGLDARPIGSSAYTLVQLPHMTELRPVPRFADYAAALQQAVTVALCRGSETRPTHYRMVIRLWLNPAGAVARVEQGSSTGDIRLDLAVESALQHIDVGMPVPAGLPQPVKLAIMPLTMGDAACPSMDGQALPDFDH